MKIEKCIKESFTVIGKEGSTSDGKTAVNISKEKPWNKHKNYSAGA